MHSPPHTLTSEKCFLTQGSRRASGKWLLEVGGMPRSVTSYPFIPYSLDLSFSISSPLAHLCST